MSIDTDIKTLIKTLIREVVDGDGIVAGGRRLEIPRIERSGIGVIAALSEPKDAENIKYPRAACVLVRNGDYVLAVSRRDDPTAFGLPGGKVDAGEDDATAAARELFEETGLTATHLNQIFSKLDDNNYVCTTFEASVKGKIHTNESGVIRWVKPSTLIRGPFGRYNQELFDTIGWST